MRNSEAQKYARWSLAAAGLLAVAVAGVYARNIWVARQAEKKAPPAVPPTVEQRSNEFSYSKVEGQRTIYTVKASRTTEFKEGSRNLLEDVAIVVNGKKGERNDTLLTKACDFISNTGKISCAGEVQIRLQAAGAPQASPNAIQVTTSAVTFDRDSGEARTDKPVTFRWPAGEGRAVGVSYDSNSGTLRLHQSVELNLSFSSSNPPEKTEATDEKIVRVAGDSMSFQREKRIVVVDGDVHAQQTTLELTADKLLLELDAAFQARRFVASGHPQLHDLSPQGPLALSADEIDSGLRPDGSIETIVATGNVHGTRNTPVGGDGIDAGRVQVDLVSSDNTPRLLTASNGVTLTSTSASFNGGTRHVESDALEIHFSSNSRPGQTLVESVNTLAPARVDWQNVALVNGKPVPQSTRMAGKQMNLKFDAQNQLQQLLGAGGVEVTRKLGDAPDEITASRELTAKFDGAGAMDDDRPNWGRSFPRWAAHGSGRPRPRGSRQQYFHAGWLRNPRGCHDADHGAIGVVRSRGEYVARRWSRADHGFAPHRGEYFESRAGACARFGRTSHRGHGARACGVLRKRKIVAGTVGDRGRHNRIGQPDAHPGGEGKSARSIPSGGMESEARRSARAVFEQNGKAAIEQGIGGPSGASWHAAGACQRRIADVLGDGVARSNRTGRKGRFRARLHPSQPNRSLFFRQRCRKRHQTIVAFRGERRRDRPPGRPPRDLGPGRIHGLGRQVCSFGR